MNRPTLQHLSFYRFVALACPQATARVLRELTRHLTGSILVAPEGISGAVAGSPAELRLFEAALTDDPRLHAAFAGMRFKRSACSTPPYARMKVHEKPEIVALGLPEAHPLVEPTVSTPLLAQTHIDPQAWRELLRRDDVVVLDNRNSFEWRLGRFVGAQDPQVAHFRDFPRHVLARAPAWRAERRRVAMYCTGGIRCEKTAAWMLSLGLDVVQLEGGILNYFQSLPDAERDWEGECFVFDNRIALNTRLEETGTTLERVYRDEPDGEWRLQRARRLYAAVAGDPPRPAEAVAGAADGRRRMRRGRPSPLPMRDGVSPSCIALPALHQLPGPPPWPTVEAFLAERCPAVDRTQWALRMAAGEVVDDTGQVLPPGTPYLPGARLHYYREVPTETPILVEEQVLYRDDHILVADKPHFLPVMPSGRYVQETLLVRLRRRLGLPALAPAHRIDRETAGLLLFTLQPDVRDRYQALFRNRRVHKVYEAIAPVRPDLEWPRVCRHRLVEPDPNDPAFMQMRIEPGQPNAETRIALIETGGPGGSLGRYELRPSTGQRHQLRVQMNALGLPIVHDRIYPVLQPEQAVPDYARPLQLLARELGFTDPLTGQERFFTSRLSLRRLDELSLGEAPEDQKR